MCSPRKKLKDSLLKIDELIHDVEGKLFDISPTTSNGTINPEFEMRFDDDEADRPVVQALIDNCNRTLREIDFDFSNTTRPSSETIDVDALIGDCDLTLHQLSLPDTSTIVLDTTDDSSRYEFRPFDNDVIFVGEDSPANLNIIDLCTPERGRRNDRPRPRQTDLEEEIARRNAVRMLSTRICGMLQRLEGNNEETTESTEPTDSLNGDVSIISSSETDTEPISLTDETNDGPKKSNFTCAVCLENLMNKKPVSTSCGHLFCLDCLEQAIKITRKCPLCNKKQNSKSYHRIYF